MGTSISHVSLSLSSRPSFSLSLSLSLSLSFSLAGFKKWRKVNSAITQVERGGERENGEKEGDGQGATERERRESVLGNEARERRDGGTLTGNRHYNHCIVMSLYCNVIKLYTIWL
jgi:hypothetical protein